MKRFDVRIFRERDWQGNGGEELHMFSEKEESSVARVHEQRGAWQELRSGRWAGVRSSGPCRPWGKIWILL